MQTIGNVIARTGDADPVAYGGGVVLETAYGHVYEWCDEVSADATWRDTRDVYQVPVPDDVCACHDWALWDRVAAFGGMTLAHLHVMARSTMPAVRALVLEMLAKYYSPMQVGAQVLWLTDAQLAQRWELDAAESRRSDHAEANGG